MGTSTSEKGKRLERRDHPHAYGDKVFLKYLLIVLVGSSPRVWGQGLQSRGLCYIVRIIPTRMGTSTSEKGKRLERRDHPHAYGDKVFLKYLLIVLVGSSPRVWGQGLQSRGLCYIVRIIPTRMGTRLLFVCKNTFVWDHPHAYGDK